MEYIKQIKDYKSDKKTAVTLGKFDGFHRGHQLLVDKIKEYSSSEVDSLILAFDIGGRGLLSKEEQRDRVKEEVDVLISCPLSDEIKKMSPETFVEEVLVKKLNVKYLVVGSDFQFGHNREGNIDLLRDCSKRFGFNLEVMPKLTFDSKMISNTLVDGKMLGSALFDDKIISSSLIKEFLEKGEIEQANHLLGYDYEIASVVSNGRKLGRTIGFPTLNIIPDQKKVIPKYGVYGCKVEIENSSVDHGLEYEGICNIGTKPTAVCGGEPVAEVHVFDFHEDAYGKKAKIKLITFVRPEQKFSSIEELKSQIEQDIVDAKNKWPIKQS